MRGQEEALRRLARVRVFRKGGVEWYRADEVCSALGANRERALRWVRSENKAWEWEGKRLAVRRRVTLVNRDGVKTIAMSRGGLSCAAVMDALDAAGGSAGGVRVEAGWTVRRAGSRDGGSSAEESSPRAAGGG